MVTLVVMDGFGISEKIEGNAIKKAGTPYLDKLADFPFAMLDASGQAVGLSENQMGNSEVGHLNMGAGRVVYQDLPKIDNEIKNKQFFANKNLNKAMDNVNICNSSLHLIGLVSDGGVHSHINHLKALIDMAKQKKVERVYIHAILDGRDTPQNSGLAFIEEIEEYAKNYVQIKTVMGRVYAMDREKRWDRVEKAYDAIALAQAENFYQTANHAIKDNYENNVFDEFIQPCVIGKPVKVDSFDSVIFFNFRTDRARELTQAFTDENFDKFKTSKLKSLCFCCMTEYSEDLKNVIVAYKGEKITNNLSAILSKHGKKQFHISETTKYAHVTFFFNGGIEKNYEGEDRKLIESENVVDFSKKPKMKAFEITEEVLKAIASKKYDFILVNISNADMIGHTGKMDAAMEAVSVVDKCAYTIALSTLMCGGHCIVTADHGNIEQMLDESGEVCTTHTTNKVPFYLVSEKFKNVKLESGALANIAPTVLKLLEIEKPSEMSNSLF